MDNFPEKILLVQDDNVIKDYWVLENLTDCKDMEYIRKDMFINKACEWLENNLVRETPILACGYIDINFGSAIKKFREYFKEE